MNGNKEKSLKFNFIMNMILTMSSFIFPLISFPYISRILLPEGTGKVNFAVSLIAYFNMFAQLGIPTYGIKACAKYRNNREELSRTVHELLFINIVTALISYTVLVVAIFNVPKLNADRAVYIITSLTIFLSAIGMEWLYQALEDYTYITIRSIAFKLVALILMFLLIHDQKDYVIYAGILIIASGASNILNFINARKYVDFKFLGGYNVKRHLRVVLIFFALACTTTIYTNLDNVMLGFIKTDTDVGLYSAAVKIKNVLVSLIAALGTVLLPRASYYVENGRYDEFRKITKKAINFVVIVAVPVTLYFTIFAEESIQFIAGSAFKGAVLPMQIIMPTLVFIGLTNILGIEIMVPTGREKTVLHSTIVGAVVDLILNAILIPRYAASGAAIGTLAAELSVFVYQAIALKGEISDAFREISWWKILVALIFSIIAALFIKYRNYSTFKTLLYSAAVFFVVYGLILVILKDRFVTDTIDTVLNMSFFKEANVEIAVLFAFAALLPIALSEGTVIVGKLPGYNVIFPLVKIVLYGIAAVTLFINFFRGYYSKREICIIVLSGIVIALAFYKSKDLNLLIYFLFIIAMVNVNLDKVCRWTAISRGVLLIVIVGLTLAGLIENLTTVRSDGVVREFLGFTWTTSAPNLLLYTSFAWVYWRKDRITVWECAAIIGLAILFYIRTNTKSAFAFTIMTIVLALLLKYIPAIRNYKRVYGIANIIEIPVCALSIILVSAFGNLDSPWISKINALLTGRLSLGQDAIKNYGITLFGNNIIWIGGEGIGPDGSHAYNYVDSSFLHILLNYGIVFLCILLIYLILIAVQGMKKKDTYLTLVLILLVLHVTFDPQLIDMNHNVFLVALSYLGVGLLNKKDEKT